MAALRRIEKFTNRAGDEEFDFTASTVTVTRLRMDQGYRSPRFYAAGQHYPARVRGFSPALRDVRNVAATIELADFATADPAVVDAAVDELLATCHRFGLGKLWTIDDDSVRRWAWAELAAAPFEMGPFNFIDLPLELTWAVFSDWYGETPVTGSQAVSASPTSWDITNGGSLRAGMLEVRFRAGSTGGFANNPTLANARGDQAIAFAIDAASADDEIRIRPDDDAAEYSDDDGATYSDAYDDVTLADDQAVLFELPPGVNPITYTQDSGTPDLTISWSYYEAFGY